jgi:transcriptional regulator of acetoin/glycerol metabolism
VKTLERNQWNVSQTARDLGISRMTLYRLLDKHRISREDGDTKKATKAY